MSHGTLASLLRTYVAEKRRYSPTNWNDHVNRDFFGGTNKQSDGIMRKTGITAGGDFTTSDVVNVALQIARGMKFIASHQVLKLSTSHYNG
jgi:hypothetical protein